MPCYEIDGVKPVIHPSTYVHPSAVIIGLVTIGKHCYIGPHASIRGDYGQIIFEDGVNFQDGCIAHAFPGGCTVIRKNGHISHGAVLHGCEIGENTMVGIQTVIMDNAKIGPECMVAALSYIKPKFEAPARSVIAGSPAVIKRTVTEKEMHWKSKGTAVYHDLTKRSLSTMNECMALTEKTHQNTDLNIPQFKPLK